MPDISQYDDDICKIIIHEPKFTRLDKARQKCRDLEDEQERLSAIDSPTPSDLRLLVIVKTRLENANQRYALENERAADDVFRRWEAINQWRKDNPDLYNKPRRKVRDKPNVNLKDLTEAEAKQHRLDQKADSKWKGSQRKKGMSEDRIEAAFAIRLQERTAARAKAAFPATKMEDFPEYGAF